MAKKILVDANYPNETRVVLIDSNCYVEEIEYETLNKHLIKGNIYLATITRIEPSLQAAFIEYDNGKSGFLPFSEIHPDYYNLSNSKTKFLPLVPIYFSEITLEDIKEQEKSDIIEEEVEDDIGEDITQKELDEDDLKKNTVDSEIYKIEDIEGSIEEDIFPIELNESSNELLSTYKQDKIQDVIQKGQVILVQASKESRGNKNASFTSYISLVGRYCVLTPNRANSNGISRRISNSKERKRLKAIIDNITAKNTTASIIIRTPSVGKTAYAIKKDCNYLSKLWNKILETTKKKQVPAFIYVEHDIIQKTIRDMYNSSVKEIIIQGKTAYDRAIKFMSSILPSEVSKIKNHKSKIQLFTQYNIEEQLSSLYKPRIILPSGAYIVINPTEALIAIDINSGKATSENTIEETAIKINLEAIKEIARQIRLRELSGLIIIDVIDMLELKHRKMVERAFKRYLSKDKARIQINTINSFGLLEMSRQRLRPSFLESNSTMCFHCSGKGIVRAEESNAMIMLRTIENEVHGSKANVINVYAHLNSITYILNNKRLETMMIENKYNVQLRFYNDFQSTADSFSIEKVILPKGDIESNDFKLPLVSSTELLDNIENVKNLDTTLPNNQEVDFNVEVDQSVKSNKIKWKKKTENRKLKSVKLMVDTVVDDKSNKFDNRISNQDAKPDKSCQQNKSSDEDHGNVNKPSKPKKKRRYKRNKQNQSAEESNIVSFDQQNNDTSSRNDS